MRQFFGFLGQRAIHFGVYAVYGGIAFGIYLLAVNLIPHGNKSETTTTVGTVASGGKILNITHNEAPERRQGLYVSLTSQDATVGVFKQVTENLRVSIGAGQTYDNDFKAEVRAEVSF